MTPPRNSDRRTEKDALGPLDIPADAYWGIHTRRALDNFPISGTRVPPSLIHSLADVKKAACSTNQQLGFLPDVKARAIIQACDEISAGRLDDQFPLDALQGGAGTSTNMNINEVIANRASEILGGPRGAGAAVSPLEEVNLHQSTNDVYPTALKVAALRGLRNLSRAIESVQGSFQKKEKEFASILKMGRTETQDAVPITLGAEFGVFAEAFARDRWRTFKCEERLRTVNLGGTAVGTGLTAPRDYVFRITDALRELTGLPLARAENLMDPTANADAFVETSGILKAHATNLIKICGDLRWMNSLGEIRLEKRQAGSSIMPGKINPVLLEAGIQTGLKVQSNDLLITESVSRGTFQLCEFMPLLALAFLESLEILTRFDALFSPHIERIEADVETCRARMDSSPTIITAFLPHIGYERAEEILRRFHASGQKDLHDFLHKELGKDTVERILSPSHVMSLGYPHEPNS
ncbi:MAG TPA: aspartate ammonia-lyase [Elusimicrobiota bacterium]|nr:aspartate ammonia-lyase [Elusimicrobiota bacterium]